ncbi:uncharacterized protein [Bemisia tabaci]|uniref:uncharacterized protein isoform X4 n=1 Tax=Bemisia tabaci TaxID=7038 RepID=UPI003B28B192
MCPTRVNASYAPLSLRHVHLMVFIDVSKLMRRGRHNTGGPWAASFLGYGNRYQSCNTPCPPWRCEDDSAIIHGTCCGCSNWLNPYSWSISCVNDLQCPNPYTSPLCSDFQWMLRCCCS